MEDDTPTYNITQDSHTLRIADPRSRAAETFHVYDSDRTAGKTFGVYGIVEYDKSRYLITISDARVAGSIHGSDVLEVRKIKIYTIGGTKNQLLIDRIAGFFGLPGLYFSKYDLFLRNSGQKNREFLFNSHPLSVYRRHHTHFTVNCIQGFFGRWRDLCLISRRSCLRAGVRYFSRGCDMDGNCSNFVETEQILLDSSSYLQIRGSIPLAWGHRVGWAYSPKIVLQKDDSHVFLRAHEHLKRMYGEDIIYLNLTKDYGYEKCVFEEFNRTRGALRGYNFDFHREISGKKYPFDFVKTGLTSTESTQNTVVRTNCMDCLDRTNSMQFIIGQRMLREQLGSRDQIDQYECEFRNLFHQNGVYLSLQYSGTPALCVRHIQGGRSVALDRIRDGAYSCKRYLINRLSHGQLQNSYDILTGRKTGGALVDRGRKTATAICGFLILVILAYLREEYKSLQICPTAAAALLLFGLFYVLFSSILDLPFK